MSEAGGFTRTRVPIQQDEAVQRHCDEIAVQSDAWLKCTSGRSAGPGASAMSHRLQFGKGTAIRLPRPTFLQFVGGAGCFAPGRLAHRQGPNLFAMIVGCWRFRPAIQRARARVRLWMKGGTVYRNVAMERLERAVFA